MRTVALTDVVEFDWAETDLDVFDLGWTGDATDPAELRIRWSAGTG